MFMQHHGDTVLIERFAVSGRTMLKQAKPPLWNEIEFSDTLKYVPDVCVILLGTNDSNF